MVKYKERQFFLESKETHANVDRDFPDQRWNPPLAVKCSVPYYTPRISRLYERFWEDDLATWSNGFFIHKNHDSRLREDLRSQDTWKPCQHYKCYLADTVGAALDLPPVTPWKCQSATALGFYTTKFEGVDPYLVVDSPVFRASFGEYGLHSAGLPSCTVSNKDQSFVPAPFGLSSLVERSLKSMLPDLKSELSLINSIIELKDFVTLKHTITGALQTLSNVAKFSKRGFRALGPGPLSIVRKSFDPSQGLTLRELTHTGADGFLQAEFNILPLLSDLQAIQKALVTVHKRMNRLLQQEGRPQKRHWTYKWIPGEFVGANSTITYQLNLGQFAGYYNPSGQTGVYRALSGSISVDRIVEVLNPATFHAEIEYTYEFTQYQREHAEVLSLLDLLGVDLNPVIIWNAIPWSFVIDWVIGINRWLANRRQLNMEPRLSISRYMWSWSYTRKIRTVYYSPTTEAGRRIPRTYLPDLYEEAYRRDIEMPSFSNSLYGSGFSGMELSLGGALAITRAYHPNRLCSVSRLDEGLLPLSM